MKVISRNVKSLKLKSQLTLLKITVGVWPASEFQFLSSGSSIQYQGSVSLIIDPTVIEPVNISK